MVLSLRPEGARCLYSQFNACMCEALLIAEKSKKFIIYWGIKMAKTLKTKDKTLEVRLFERGVEIELSKCRDVAIEVRVISPTNPLTPPGALFRIGLYKSYPKAKVCPFEYDVAYVMADGTLLKKGKE